MRSEPVTLERKSQRGYLLKLAEYLNENFPGCLIMPASEGGKLPLMPHKNDAYTFETFLNKGIKECDKGVLILLTEDLIVVDVDDHDTCEQLEEMVKEKLWYVKPPKESITTSGPQKYGREQTSRMEPVR
jgi:hypothetical protein